MNKEKDLLPVAEVFFSIQGEGQTTGIPAVFLRLGGCNILCQSKNWICDTIEVWRKSKATKFEDVIPEEYIDNMRNSKTHLVITGGEPLIHQETIIRYLDWFEKKYEFLPIVEVETNGTIIPKDELLLDKVIYWNCSPKLSNAGNNPFEVRRNIKALETLCSAGLRTIFKFVISDEKDVDEIHKDFLPYIDEDQIYLMPAGANQEELNKTRLLVVELCKKHLYIYTDRQHIVIWNKKTGV